MNKKTCYTIVVVDEDRMTHELIKTLFQPNRFKVICFNSAGIALQESLTTGQSWDVLLTDYHFSDVLASEFTKLITTRLPLLPVILITPLELADAALIAISEGAYDFVQKPIHFGQLQVAVNRAISIKKIIHENIDLKEVIRLTPSKTGNLIGSSPRFLAALDIANRVAKSNSSILLSGESGTGKEVFANYIHKNSRVSQGPFVAINCASIPDNLLESELFGHAKGSFTGALEKHIGLFEAAENGTLFLDEIGDLSLHLQAKLLRVLQEKQIRRVGENKNIKINCRFISATHKNLTTEISEERFREDLFFRLNVIPIAIPPLRDRPEDLLPLAEFFLKKYSLANNSKAKTFSKGAIEFIVRSVWRGNVRELENTVERAVALCKGTEIIKEDFIPLNCTMMNLDNGSLIPHSHENIFSFGHLSTLPTVEEVIKMYIAYAISKNGGARDKTAKEIGIDRKTLYRRMQSSPVSQKEFEQH